MEKTEKGYIYILEQLSLGKQYLKGHECSESWCIVHGLVKRYYQSIHIS